MPAPSHRQLQTSQGSGWPSGPGDLHFSQLGPCSPGPLARPLGVRLPSGLRSRDHLQGVQHGPAGLPCALGNTNSGHSQGRGPRGPGRAVGQVKGGCASKLRNPLPVSPAQIGAGPVLRFRDTDTHSVSIKFKNRQNLGMEPGQSQRRGEASTGCTEALDSNPPRPLTSCPTMRMSLSFSEPLPSHLRMEVITILLSKLALRLT